MPDLLLGPLLRYVGETEATVWVETGGPCEVQVLGGSVRTFGVRGRHYALVYVEGLEPGSETEYEVRLDGEKAWPPAGYEFPPPVIRTPKGGEPIKLTFGSCRVCRPHAPPYTLTRDQDERGREIDAIYAYALRMLRQPRDEWPHLCLMIGDQVYADEVSPKTLEFIRARRDTSEPPGEEVADFAEYVALYHESWSDPVIRWLLSTVSTAMLFDDHDVHDDWNTSQAWVEEMHAQPWWDERIAGGLMAYWIYQHLGNLPPRELEENSLFRRVREADDAGDMLHEFALDADRDVNGKRWSYCRDIAQSRVIVMDSRAGRVLDGKRRMVDDDEWHFIQEHAAGDFNHVFLATTVPVLLLPGMHYLEAWNENVCGGAWGRRAARVGERIRQGLDLEHWAAFQDSFHRVVALMRELGSGERGDPPASIVALSGDVHHAYLAEVAFPREAGVKSSVYQAVCSPFRNPLSKREKLAVKLGASHGGELIGRALARAAGAHEPEIRWRLGHNPVFDNQIATIEWEGREAGFRIERAVPGDAEHPRLDTTIERRLA
jgi:hypothetical protein